MLDGRRKVHARFQRLHVLIVGACRCSLCNVDLVLVGLLSAKLTLNHELEGVGNGLFARCDFADETVSSESDGVDGAQLYLF